MTGKKTTFITSVFRKILVATILLFSMNISGQNVGDSTKTRRLQEVNIDAGTSRKVFNGPAAVQQISTQTIKQLPVLQLSDALKYMAGVVVRDYGGTGGMKTVSVRGLGSQHTGVAYDDIAITDCQTGQVDLGKLSIENVSALSLVIGTDNNIFVPARLFSYSSLLKINTINNIPENKFAIRAGVGAGMYGMYSAQLGITNKIVSKKRENRLFFWNLSGDYTQSKGNFPYILHYGGINDSTSREIRKNSQTNILTSEFNAVWQLDRKQRISVKAYFYNSDRELPPATVFYNTSSRQKLWNTNAFVQAHYHNYFNDKWAYQANIKYNYDFTRYHDPDYLNAEGFLDNRYVQTESYFSNSLLFTPISNANPQKNIKKLQFALAEDLFYQKLNANTLTFEKPARLTSLTSLSGIIGGNRWSVNGNLLLTYVNNILHDDTNIADYIHLSPAIGATFKINSALNIRTFYKNIFRMPTFNDLYYREVGNISLEPEKTQQWNIGIVLNELHVSSGKIFVSASLDGYFNIVKDKIVAFPTHNLFSWTMLNYGKVIVAGADANMFWQYRINSRYALRLDGSFSYQKAIDRTEKDSKTYNHQIPYTPKFSGSASLSLQTPYITITYATIICGKRYALSQNIPANEVSGYADHSFTLSHNFNFKSSTLSLKAEFLNISNKNYEIIRNYPMQGFGFRAKVVYEFAKR